MPFTPKDWKNYPDTTTPITAEALEDMETRLADYADTVAAALKAGLLTTGLASARPTAATAGSGAVYLATDTRELSRSNGSAWSSIAYVASALRQRDVQVFTSSGTWTKPAGAAADPRATMWVMLLGGGGGGGSGARRASGVVSSGGAGGGGAGITEFQCPATDFAGTSTIVIGVGGVGGAAVTTDDTNGNPGTAGGNTTMSGHISGLATIKGREGGGGGGGAAGAGSTGGYGSGAVYGPNATGGNGASGAAGGTPSPNHFRAGGSGGAGGGVASGPAFRNGANASYLQFYALSGASGGAADGAAGGNGTAAAAGVLEGAYGFGGGGGGGASSVLTAGGAGGNAGNYGGGGGGGGASINGNNSGAGGNGAPGIAIIITEWGG